MATVKSAYTPTITVEKANAYWNVVLDCLLQFHNMPKTEAINKIWSVRQKIEAPPPGIIGEVFYNTEPFEAASNLAGQPLNIAEYREQYVHLLHKHGW